MTKPEVARHQASEQDVKKRRDKAAEEEEPLIIPMSPQVAAIIHAHLPELWVQWAKFVGPDVEGLNVPTARISTDKLDEE